MGQVNLDAGFVRTVGKGSKERIVPVGEIAEGAVGLYLKTARRTILKGKSSEHVFITNRGGKMTRQNFWIIIKSSP